MAPKISSKSKAEAAVNYIRSSSPSRIKDDNPRRQTETIEEYARLQGMSVVNLQELGISASLREYLRKKSQPGLTR